MAKVNYVTGLDIGTSKICAIVAAAEGDGTVGVLGMGRSGSEGLRRGVVANLERTVESVKNALEAAESSSGVHIDSVFVGVAGGHVQAINSHGVVGVGRKDKEITHDDVERVLDAARAVNIPMDRELLHVFPQGFVVDDQRGIKDPVGIVGVRLEAQVLIVTGAVTATQNIIKSVNRAGCDVEDIVLEPFASGEAVLTQDEKELGVALVDVGGGTTDIAIFVEGAIRHSKVLAIGGEHVTRDIAVGLRTPIRHAEQIKISCGHAIEEMVGEDETITVPGVGDRGDRTVPRRELATIIEPRMDELLFIVNGEIERSGYKHLIPTGVVLTGGASLLQGTLELGESIFECPVRLGRSREIVGRVEDLEDPAYATGVGLVRYGLRCRAEGRRTRFDKRNLFVKTARRMKEWITEYF
ncbi:MAG: cell division protein FtsA [Candidatus Hydrogenedentes bacterium]|nr:cell division protein FtsA [Candidatus Hydrogenedentota bacterium]